MYMNICVFGYFSVTIFGRSHIYSQFCISEIIRAPEPSFPRDPIRFPSNGVPKDLKIRRASRAGTFIPLGISFGPHQLEWPYTRFHKGSRQSDSTVIRFPLHSSLVGTCKFGNSEHDAMCIPPTMKGVGVARMG